MIGKFWTILLAYGALNLLLLGCPVREINDVGQIQYDSSIPDRTRTPDSTAFDTIGSDLTAVDTTTNVDSTVVGDAGVTGFTINQLRTNPPADGTAVQLADVVVMSVVFFDQAHEDFNNPMPAFFVSQTGITTTAAQTGLEIVVATNATAPTVTPGEVVTITGLFYSDAAPAFDNSIIKVGENDTITVTGSQNAPAPATVTVAEAASEEWEGVLLTIESGVVTEVSYYDPVIDNLLQIEGHIIASFTDSGYANWNASVGQSVVSITGFGFYSFSQRMLLPPSSADYQMSSSDGGTPDIGNADIGNTDTATAVDATMEDATAADGTAVVPDAATEDAGYNCGVSAEHLLLSEITVTPAVGEFVEIHNPTGASIDLSHYYLWNNTYKNISGCNSSSACNAVGVSDVRFHWMIPQPSLRANLTPGSGDFVVKFPDGASIGAGEYQTISIATQDEFCTTFGKKPNYELKATPAASCSVHTGTVATMVGDMFGYNSIHGSASLTNSGEELILFQWSGVDCEPVKDVDYGLWGDQCEASDRIGSSICSGAVTYTDDTLCASQTVIQSAAHSDGESYQRTCNAEIGEVATEGNGISGHNETSEDLSRSWGVAAATPGS